MEPAAASGSVAPVYNDLDLLVVAHDGSSETTFFPNNLAVKDPNNTVEMVTISGVDSYEWFNVSAAFFFVCSYCSLVLYHYDYHTYL